jgi:Flp pilus assembly protein CpaB
MGRSRFLILIGILLAVAAAGLLLVMNRESTNGKEPSVTVEDDGTREVMPTAPPPPTPVPNPVVVAKQRIPRGTRLITDTIPLSGWISVESWPQSWVTQDALTSFRQVAGKIARLDIPRGTVLTADMLTDQAGDLAEIGSDAALMIPPGRVAIAIPVDHISSVGWSLRRGDHVDVLASFLFVDLDEEFQSMTPNQASPIGIIPEDQVPVQGALGRFEQDPFGLPINVVPSEPQRPRLVSQITVRDAVVLNVGPWGELFREAVTTELIVPEAPSEEEGQEVDGAPPAEGEGEEESVPQQVEFIQVGEEELSEEEVLRKYLNASTRQPLLLVVSPQDALVLKWAGDAGADMHIVLRSFDDAGVRLPDTEMVTLQYMVDRFNMALPPGLAYGIEPAVRQLERTLLQELDRLWPIQQTGTEGPPR